MEVLKEVAMSNDGQNAQNSQDDEVLDTGLDDDFDEKIGMGSDEMANNPGVQSDDAPDETAQDERSVENMINQDGQDDTSSEASSDNQDESSPEKDPKDWTTGDEPATAAQKSYISTMAVEAKEEVPFELSKAEASEKITELQEKTGRDSSNERP
jgi:hypothetical protein